MELKQMKYFKTIVEEGTITQAARVLHISQPPLSMQLKAIEEELDTILIERGHRHITLTPAGHLFYRRCNQMLNLYEQTSKEVQGAATQILRFGITSSNGYLITHEHMDVFRKKYPKLDIHMKEGTTYEMMDLITGMAQKNHQTLVIVTHDQELAEYADRIVVLQDGKIEKIQKRIREKKENVYE